MHGYKLDTFFAEIYPMSLTPKQNRFIDEYMVDLNATQAAIRAGYSAKTAYSIGAENLTKPEIDAAIQTAMAERATRTVLTADKVLQDIERVRAKAEEEGRFTAALRASELQGKHLRIWDRVQEYDTTDLFREFAKAIKPTVGPPCMRDRPSKAVRKD